MLQVLDGVNVEPALQNGRSLAKMVNKYC